MEEEEASQEREEGTVPALYDPFFDEDLDAAEDQEAIALIQQSRTWTTLMNTALDNIARLLERIQRLNEDLQRQETRTDFARLHLASRSGCSELCKCGSDPGDAEWALSKIERRIMGGIRDEIRQARGKIEEEEKSRRRNREKIFKNQMRLNTIMQKKKKEKREAARDNVASVAKIRAEKRAAEKKSSFATATGPAPAGDPSRTG